MSLKMKIRGIGARLVLWSMGLFFISVVGVSSTIYFLAADTLRKTDREVTERLALTYEKLFFEHGETVLRDEITPEFAVTIVNSRHQTIFEFSPKYIDNDFEDEDEINQVKAELRKLPLKKGWKTILLLSGEEDIDFFEGLEHRLRLIALKNDWSQILPLIDNDSFEVFVTPIRDGYWMKIGRSSEDREEQLSKIRYIAFIIFIPFMIVGIILSLFLAWGVLSPIRDLVSTIQKIKSGNRDLRANYKSSGDEIDVLSYEFNSLLDQNSNLFNNLKSTIDNVAHDLRTPLTRFRISAEDALRNQDDIVRLREALSDGMENTDIILKLLNSIMDVSEAESNTLKINHDKVYLRGVIERVIDVFQFVAEEKQINVHSDLDELNVLGDESRLTQVFSNLIDNAIKFSPSGSTIWISLKKEASMAKIIFRDEGLGVSKEDLDRIWERLYRGDSSRSTSGLGIGLSLVKAIVSVHKGSVLVDSTSNGSCFTVLLPLCNSHEREW